MVLKVPLFWALYMLALIIYPGSSASIITTTRDNSRLARRIYRNWLYLWQYNHIRARVGVPNSHPY